MDPEFVNQLTGSSAANALTVFLLLIVWFVKNKCKHSRCRGHSICCDFSFKEDDEGETRPEPVRKEVKIQMQKLQRSKHQSLHGSD